MSLRGRLTLVLVAVLAVGLAVSAATTSTLLRAELRRRVDVQLREVEPYARQLLIEQRLAEVGRGAEPASGTKTPSAESETGEVLVARIDANGSVVDRIVPPLSGRSDILDAIPADLVAEARAGQVRRTDVTIDGAHYRVLVRRFDRSGDVAAVVAPLRDVEDTLAHLRRLEVFGSLGLLVLGGLAAWWLVGIGLRPLHAMADTADAIASGAVDRRVEQGSGTRGEVPRLAAALNNAFEVRHRSEDKLRRFVTDASHELRTPLTTIRGYAELYRSGALADPAAADRAIGRIESEADRMGVLVDDLLLLARLDQGRPPERQPVDLVDLAVDAVSDAHAAGPQWPVALTAGDPVVVQGDELRLRQLLANLLANGRQHTPPGTPLAVSVSGVGGEAVVSVVDDGPGLPPGPTAQVFDRFWRADPSRSHPDGRAGGNGLGLSIVRAIAEAHGGSVEAADEPGHGARFTVRLPFVAPATTAATMMATMHGAGSVGPPGQPAPADPAAVQPVART